MQLSRQLRQPAIISQLASQLYKIQQLVTTQLASQLVCLFMIALVFCYKYGLSILSSLVPRAGIYLLKVNYRNTRNTSQWHCSGIFIVKFEHISHLVLVFLLLFNLEHVITGWVNYFQMLTHSLTESVKMVFLWLTNLEAGDNIMFFFLQLDNQLLWKQFLLPENNVNNLLRKSLFSLQLVPIPLALITI